MSDSIASVRQEKLFSDYIRSGVSKVEKGFNFAVNEAGEGGTINNISKVARRLFEFLAVFQPIGFYFGPAGVFFRSVAQTFQVFSIFKNAKHIADHENIVKVAIGALGITHCSMVVAKIMEGFNWFTLAQVSLRIGTATLAFGSFMSMIEIVKESLEISLNINNLVKTSRKIGIVNRKRKFWSEGLSEEKCQKRAHQYTLESGKLEQAIEQLNAKKTQSAAKAEKWSLRYQAQQDQIKAQRATRGKTKRVFGKASDLFRKVFATHNLKKARKWIKIDDQNKAALEKTQKEHQLKLQKKNAFEKMAKRFSANIPEEKKVRYAEDLAKIKTFCESKLQKWNFKKINFRWDQALTVAGIMVSVAVIVMSVASIVLLFTGPGGLVLPIVLGSLSLATALFGTGLHFYKKFKKGKPIQTVETPRLSRKKEKEEEEKRAEEAQNRLRAANRRAELAI